MLTKLTTGIQHIGIPAMDLDRSVMFYESLGFECIHIKSTHHNDVPIEVAFVKLHDLVIELYELEGHLLEEIKQRKDGHIDHFTINALNVEELLRIFKESDFQLLDDELQFIDFFEHGVKFFRILGPSKEIIEFNQIM